MNLNVAGVKKLEGRPLKSTDIWTYTISSDDDNAPLPDPAEVYGQAGPEDRDRHHHADPARRP